MNAVATKQDVLGRIRSHSGKIRDLGVEALGLLGRRVELVTPEGLSPYLGPHILAEVQDVALGA